MKAVVVQQDKTVKVQEKPDPKIKPNEVLVRIKVIGQNPTDWKHATGLSEPGMISGCDAAGVVEQIGDEVPAEAIATGQRVAFFTRGGVSHTHGAFAELVAMPYDLVFKIPPNWSLEEAASIPIPFFTAVQALYTRIGLDAPTPGKVLPLKQKDEWLLVWSGASSVGQYAIQLGALSGYKVVTTASKQNHDLLKQLGAAALFEYKDPDVASKIKEVTGDKLKYALDCVIEGNSQEVIGQVLAADGTCVVVLPASHDKFAEGQRVIETLVYTALTGKDESFGDWHAKAGLHDREDHVQWLNDVYPLLKEGHIKPLPLLSLGGLDAVQKGFEKMQKGEVRSQKLVYKV